MDIVTFRQLAKRTGMTRNAIAAVVYTHEVPFTAVGRAKAVGPEGLAKLGPILKRMGKEIAPAQHSVSV